MLYVLVTLCISYTYTDICMYSCTLHSLHHTNVYMYIQYGLDASYNPHAVKHVSNTSRVLREFGRICLWVYMYLHERVNTCKRCLTPEKTIAATCINTFVQRM